MAKSIYENEKKMIKKYDEVLHAVSQANPHGVEADGTPHFVDPGIALIMMVQAMKLGESPAGVPDDFDWAQFCHEYYHGVDDTDEVPTEE